jgi:Rha family phage regulatory protein
MELILGGDQTQTMTSKEIAELTNKEHSNVMRDIRTIQDQVGNESIFELVDYKDAKGEIRPMYALDKKQTLLLVSGYSAVLRLKIINRWEQLEIQSKKQLPSSYIDALKALVVSEEAKEQALLQVDNLNTVLDNLLDWVSIIKIANHNGIKETYFSWRILKDKSRELGYSIKKAESPRYGYQNLYNLVVFKACYPSLNYNLK